MKFGEKVNFGTIHGFISEKTGEKILKNHPCILISDKEGNRYSFVFTHDFDFGIKDKELLYSISSPEQKFSNTRVLSEDLQITRNYYYNIMKDKYNTYKKRQEAKEIYDNLCEGYICPHPITREKVYLEQEVPHFNNAEFNVRNFKYINFKNNELTEKEQEYKRFYIEGMNKLEKAIINDRLFTYKSSFDDTNNLIEPQKEKFTLENRIDFAFALCKEIKVQKLESTPEKISKVVEINALPKAPYIKFLNDKGCFKDVDKSKINKIYKTAKLEDYDRKIAYCEKEISFREKKIAEIENYSGLGSIEKTQRYKKELILLKEAKDDTVEKAKKFIYDNYDLLEDFEPKSQAMIDFKNEEGGGGEAPLECEYEAELD